MSVQDEIWQFFANKGLPSHAIAAIMGNVEGESGFNPHIYGDGGNAYGLFQHNGPRKKALFEFAGNEKPGVGQQLEFAWKEMKGLEKGALKRLLAAKDVGTATWAFVDGFERPKYRERDFAKRLPLAHKWHSQYGDENKTRTTVPIPRPKPSVPDALPPLPDRLTGPDVLGGVPNVPPTPRRMIGPDVLGGMPPSPTMPVQPGLSSPIPPTLAPMRSKPFRVGSPPHTQPPIFSGPQPGLSSPPVPSVKPPMNLQGMFAGLLGALGGLGSGGEADAQAKQANMQAVEEAAEEAARKRAEWAIQNGWGTGLSELI